MEDKSSAPGLDVIKTEQADRKPDEKSTQELYDLDRQGRQTELAGKQLDITLRGRYAHRIFSLIVWWLVAVLILLILQSLGHRIGWHNLSDSVLITLLATTTVNVLGIFVIVANYIFPKH